MSWQENARKRAKAMQTGSKFKLTEGQNTFRILPNRSAVLRFKKEKNWKKACAAYPPFIEFVSHRDVGPDKKFIRSGKDVDGLGKCWITDVLIPRLERSRSGSDKAAAKAMRPQEQFIIQVAWIDSEGEWQGPGFFYVPSPLRPHIMDLLGNLAGRQYDHPKKSKNITINRKGTGMRDTKYGMLVLDEEGSKVPLDIVRKVKAFSEVASEYSEAAQKEAWGDDLPDIDDDDNDPDTASDLDDNEDEPKKDKKKDKKNKKPKPESEDDDDGDTNDDSDSDDDDDMADLSDTGDGDTDDDGDADDDGDEDESKKDKKNKKDKPADDKYEDDDVPF